MINSIRAVFPNRLQSADALSPELQMRAAPDNVGAAAKIPAAFPSLGTVSAAPVSFGDVLGSAVQGINDKMQAAEVQKARVMSGDSTNLHQAMLSIQEAGVAFSLMTEVRNKLVESYQEIMRMQV